MTTLRAILVLCSSLTFAPVAHAALSQGYVVEWGWNTASGTAAPARILLSNVVAVSAGSFHSLALKGEGTVVGWGFNSIGQATGVPTTNPPYHSLAQVSVGGQFLNTVISICAARNFSLALKKDGTVVTWGENYVPAGLTNIAAIAADDAHSWVLKGDGTVVGWWREQSQSFGLLKAENLSNVVAIAVGPGPQGATRGVTLKRDGTVGHWGSESIHKDASPPPGLSNVVAVAAGANHSLALKQDGTIIGWGFNKAGEATGISTTDAPHISAGQVRIGGRVLSNIVSVAAGRGYSLALKKDGTVAAWGRMAHNLYPATPPAGLTNVVAIAAGAEDFCLAITTNSAVADHFRR